MTFGRLGVLGTMGVAAECANQEKAHDYAQAQAAPAGKVVKVY